MLARIADTVDEISGGRLILGLGVGYNQVLNEDFGLPWAKRYSCFEESLAIIQGLLQSGYIDFQGEHYQVRECVLQPRGPRPTGLPLMIASMAHPGALACCGWWLKISLLEGFIARQQFRISTRWSVCASTCASVPSSSTVRGVSLVKSASPRRTAT
jgi:hypothetical protein